MAHGTVSTGERIMTVGQYEARFIGHMGIVTLGTVQARTGPTQMGVQEILVLAIVTFQAQGGDLRSQKSRMVRAMGIMAGQALAVGCRRMDMVALQLLAEFPMTIETEFRGIFRQQGLQPTAVGQMTGGAGALD